MRFTPHPYQHGTIDFLVHHPVDLLECFGSAAWLSMGLGKSVCTLTAIDRLSLVEEVYPVLVIAPLRVARSTWPDEVTKWDHLKHLRVVSITGTAAEREAALRTPADIYTVNPENIPWLVKTLGRSWKFKVVVVDEATMLKGFRTRQGGARTKALAVILKLRPARVIQLSGTPAPNGLKDLWGQCWYLDHGRALGHSYTAFEQRWFDKDFDGYGITPRPYATDQIHAAVKHLAMTVDPAEHFALEAPVVTNIYVDLPPNARRVYDEMEAAMFTQIKAGDVEVFAAAARTNKCQQIANGAIIYDENGSVEVLHDAKLEALKSIEAEACGAPLLVAYYFKADLARLKKAFPHARVLDAKPQTIKDWNAGKISMLFAHPQSAGHGLNLQYGGHQLVNFAHTWNLEHRLQILERIGPVRQLQAGFKRPVFVYNIIARGTIDEDVLERTDEKKTVLDSLLLAMKRRLPRPR